VWLFDEKLPRKTTAGLFCARGTKGLWFSGSPLVGFALWIVIEGSEKQKSSRDSGSKDRLVLILGGVHGQCNAARFFLFW
jgi:hypothetical protein